MLVAVIVLAWVLLNTWICLIVARLDRTSFDSWDELFALFLCSIISPLVFLAVKYGVIGIAKVFKKKGR